MKNRQPNTSATVTNQVELDNAIEEGTGIIFVISDPSKWLDVESNGNSQICCCNQSHVRVHSGTVEASHQSMVEARGRSHVNAMASALVYSLDNSTVRLVGLSQAYAFDDSVVDAFDCSFVKAFGNSRIIKHGHAYPEVVKVEDTATVVETRR